MIKKKTKKSNLQKRLKVIRRTIINRELFLFDELILPTVFGDLRFKVIKIDEKYAMLESGMFVTNLERIKENTWRYRHYACNKNLKVKGM